MKSEKTLKNWFGQPISTDKIKFDKFQKKIKIPFVVYVDFEAFLNPIKTCINDQSKSYTNNIQKYEVYCFGYYIKCSFDDSLSKYETYTGPHCTQVFMNRLYYDLKTIRRKNCFQKPAKSLLILDMNTCSIYETDLKGEEVLDFDNQIGVVHEVCKKKVLTPCYIPVFLHNLSNYDAHFIVHALNFVEGEIDIIPQNKEKYISFSKHPTINNQRVTLRFVDSFKFLPYSLDQMVKNLKMEEFHELKNHFPGKENFDRLCKKGIYPCEFMTSFDSLC